MNKERWDSIYKSNREFAPLNNIFLDLILRYFFSSGKVSSKKAIDIGGGTGVDALKFLKRGFYVEIVDWSSAGLETAKKDIADAGFNKEVAYTEMDIDELDTSKLSNIPADIILCKLTYAFIKDKEKFLKKIKGILTANNIFILMTPVLYKNYTYSEEDKPGIAVDFEETKSLCETIFSNVEVFHHNYFQENGDLTTFILRI